MITKPLLKFSPIYLLSREQFQTRGIKHGDFCQFFAGNMSQSICTSMILIL